MRHFVQCEICKDIASGLAASISHRPDLKPLLSLLQEEGNLQRMLIEKGIYALSGCDFEGLDERYVEVDGMYFTPIQAADYRELSIKSEGLEAMGLIISDEPNGIAWLKHRLEERPQTYQELQPEWMQDIKGIRKGDILPELRTLLEENFIQNEDGTWRIVNENDDVDVEQRKNKIFLKEFKFYLEVCRKPRGKLKDVRVEAVRAGFKQCYTDKNFADIILVGDRIPQNLLTEDEILLQYYDIASSKV